jgi:hypothetical protein
MSVWTNGAGKEYEEVCRNAASDDTWFRFFKQHPNYLRILEYVMPEAGRDYLNAAVLKLPIIVDLIDTYANNDTIGGSIVAFYDGLALSPATCRYIWIASDIYKKFRPPIGMSVVEVGGGYGGLAYVLCSTIPTETYVNYDTPSAEALWKRYTTTIGVPTFKGHAVSSDSPDYPEPDLFISTWALCELSPEVQDDYIARLVARAPMGYLICNDRDHATEARIRAVHPNVQVDKEPCNELNYVLWWKP